ncbi:hypothetical protein BH688_02955 [Kushneria phosphatilytica]|nr:hypothetical protein BH688_02955 [Kushneria phosphatilytica]
MTFGHWKADITERDGVRLAPREALYLMGVASGMTHKEIARANGVNPATVTNRLQSAYLKLAVWRSAGAVAEAMRRGWIAPLCLLLMFATVMSGQQQNLYRVRQPRNTRHELVRSVRSNRETA